MKGKLTLKIYLGVSKDDGRKKPAIFKIYGFTKVASKIINVTIAWKCLNGL